jgi:hypothetical protein
VPAVADLTIRQGDTTPAFTAWVTDQNGNGLDLTGATCTFVMREMYSSAPVVNAAMTLKPPFLGLVTYNWASTDTAAAGLYMAEIHVTLPGGGTFTYPNDGYLTVAVEENLLTSNRTLVSLGDAKDVLLVPASDHSHDAKILQFIRAVQVVVESRVGAVVPRVFDEWYDGGHPAVRLRYRPSTALGTTPLLILLACSEYIGPIEWPLAVISSPDQGQMYSCMLDVPTGTVVRRTAGGAVQAFAGGPQAVHVVYQAGQSQTPANVYEGTLELLREHYQQTQQVGAPGPGGNQVDEHEAIGELVSAKVMQWISPMRRHPSVA